MNELERGMDELRKIKAEKSRMKNKSYAKKPIEKGPFLTLKQVLEIIPLSKTSINEMCKSGEFPAKVKIGDRAVVFVRAEIDHWIAQKIKNRK